MAKFRKRPVTIEAIQFGVSTRRGEAWAWARARRGERSVEAGTDEKGHFLLIETLEGTHRADEGDWIIQGVAGELYPCKPDIFEKTYWPEADADTDNDGAALIGNERLRQIMEEGWTNEHDDAHVPGSLAQAAASYALHASYIVSGGSAGRADWHAFPPLAAPFDATDWWPFDAKCWKPKSPRPWASTT